MFRLRFMAVCFRAVASAADQEPGGYGRVLDGRIDPGKVFDLTLPLDEVAEAYRAMDERRAVTVLLQP
jgi:threonine dehydrogenase-like Zn-dependent dehydrogenase